MEVGGDIWRREGELQLVGGGKRELEGGRAGRYLGWSLAGRLALTVVPDQFRAPDKCRADSDRTYFVFEPKNMGVFLITVTSKNI